MFKLIKKKNKKRIGKLYTMHGVINTPFFLPIATKGAVKQLSPEELRELGAEIILGNTYHLWLRPGEKLVKKAGGLAKIHELERADADGFGRISGFFPWREEEDEKSGVKIIRKRR